jgi:hypothetical protein
MSFIERSSALDGSGFKKNHGTPGALSLPTLRIPENRLRNTGVTGKVGCNTLS